MTKIWLQMCGPNAPKYNDQVEGGALSCILIITTTCETCFKQTSVD